MNLSLKQLIKIVTSLLLLGLWAIPTQATSAVEARIHAAPGGAYLVFAGKFGGDLYPEDIRACKKLRVDGCASGSKITYFTLHITREGKTTTFASSSGELSEQMLTQLSQLEKGDSFRFGRIKARLPKGGEVDVHARKFVVV